MKTVLTALNAKYIHSNLAVRYLKYFAMQNNLESVSILELTINQTFEYCLKKLYQAKPDILCFSCYIWNIELVRRLTCEYKKLCPHTIIVLGGPEVSYNSEEFLSASPYIDIIIRGEGEETFTSLISHIMNKEDLSFQPGITFKVDGKIISTEDARVMDMDTLPFPYPDIEHIHNQILYYESSRGCPYGCRYCLSSVDKTVRFKSLQKIFSEMLIFIKHNVPQVKFVDRTFNCSKTRTHDILRFLLDNDNGITNFHFEISADILDNETLNLLHSARKGLFQLEIGVQSINPNTLAAVNRKTDLKKLAKNVGTINSFQNIHQHLDLIAGLPYEDYHSFKESYNFVYSLKPLQLQLGFLKLLKGSGLRQSCKAYGLVGQDAPPYEVLFTTDLPYDDVLRLKDIEELTERYYNSNRFFYTLDYLVSLHPSPFELFEDLANYFNKQSLFDFPHKKNEYYDYLYNFAVSNPNCNNIQLKWALTMDYCSHEKPKGYPDCINNALTSHSLKEIKNFYSKIPYIQKFLPEYIEYEPSQINRMAHIEILTPPNQNNNVQAILLNYKNRLLNGYAVSIDITDVLFDS